MAILIDNNLRQPTKSLKAVVLVGGEGTRLRPLTNSMPKPMVPVLNRPFLEHTLVYLKKYGVDEIVLAASYLPEVIRDHFADGGDYGIKLHHLVERSPLGTGGAVKNAERYLDNTFVVLNGDIFTDLDIEDMFAFHKRKRAKVTIALTEVDNPCAFGLVETDNDGRISSFIEKPSPERVTSHWINAGVYILEREVLGHVPAEGFHTLEKELFPVLIELGEPLYGYPFSGYWMDVGTTEKYLQLNCDLLRLGARSDLFPGRTGDDVYCAEGVCIHPSAEIVGPVLIGSGCRIGQGVRIVGPAVIGSGCSIGEHARINRAVLWNGVDVGAGVTVRGCILTGDDRAEINTGTASTDRW